MPGYRFWIRDGRKLPDSPVEYTAAEFENDQFNREGAVRITTGTFGTEIKWSAFSPCFASLYLALNWLPKASTLIVLRFNLSGWFEESYANTKIAVARIEEIIGKSEIYLTQHTFIKEYDPKGMYLPPSLKRAWQDQAVSPESGIECVFDEELKRFRVMNIGARSAIAKFYGLSPASYPCRNGGSYDVIVSEAYAHVLKTGRPRYDHVIAALRTPDNVTRWVPYQRIVIPKLSTKVGTSVCVLSEIAAVDIQVI
jgi:hypothetical protein